MRRRRRFLSVRRRLEGGKRYFSGQVESWLDGEVGGLLQVLRAGVGRGRGWVPFSGRSSCKNGHSSGNRRVLASDGRQGEEDAERWETKENLEADEMEEGVRSENLEDERISG